MSQIKNDKKWEWKYGEIPTFIVSSSLLLEIENEINSFVGIFFIKWEGLTALI